MNKKMKDEKGFTLIEMLASIIVLIAVGTVLGATLFSTLRGATKTNSIEVVKQNGYFALVQMTKMLRNAERLEDPYPCLDPTYLSITFTSPDGGQTTFTCDLLSTPATISSNGASLLDTTAVTLETCHFSCTQGLDTQIPSIGVSFSLKRATTTSFFEQTAGASPIPFETSLILRNVNR